MSAQLPPGFWAVITLLLGFLTKSFTDWMQDQRIAKREALIRIETRREEARLRQIEFQRTNLLELQETAAKFVKTIGSTHVHDVTHYRRTGTWSRELLPDDLNEADYQNRIRTRLLVERVVDDEARELGRQLLGDGVLVTMAQSEGASELGMVEVGNRIDALNERIGTLLRKLDQPE